MSAADSFCTEIQTTNTDLKAKLLERTAYTKNDKNHDWIFQKGDYSYGQGSATVTSSAPARSHKTQPANQLIQPVYI